MDNTPILYMRWDTCGGKVEDGQTRSAVDYAAYCDCENYFSEKHNKVFTRKVNAEKTELTFKIPSLTPDGIIETPKLWNLAEAQETRKGNITAKTIILGLPCQTTHDENMEMVKTMQKYFVDQYGVGCSSTIHYHSKHTPHAHMMITTRTMKNFQFTGNKIKKFNSIFEIGILQTIWQMTQNKILKSYGLYVDAIGHCYGAELEEYQNKLAEYDKECDENFELPKPC